MSALLALLSQRFTHIERLEQISPVWSGCGEIVRCRLDGQVRIVKLISVPDKIDHPRIRQSDVALTRKRDSYLVEFYWYQQFSKTMPLQAKSIDCMCAIQQGQQFALVFTDFKTQGYGQASAMHMTHIIRWLAYFHAFYIQTEPKNLWQQGNYWHLATRPDELKKVSDPQLLSLAPILDKQLRDCPYQTLIHGDAKLANFAAHNHHEHVLAYDFQYVGKGVGVVDLMYFLGSVCASDELSQGVNGYLDEYFLAFSAALKQYHPTLNSQLIEQQWRNLWPTAWADFYRFLAGWSPNHKKINQYMLSQYNKVLKE